MADIHLLQKMVCEMSGMHPPWGTIYWRQDWSLTEHTHKMHTHDLYTNRTNVDNKVRTGGALSHLPNNLKRGSLLRCAFKRVSMLSQSSHNVSVVNQSEKCRIPLRETQTCTPSPTSDCCQQVAEKKTPHFLVGMLACRVTVFSA